MNDTLHQAIDTQAAAYQVGVFALVCNDTDFLEPCKGDEMPAKKHIFLSPLMRVLFTRAGVVL